MKNPTRNNNIVQFNNTGTNQLPMKRKYSRTVSVIFIASLLIAISACLPATKSGTDFEVIADTTEQALIVTYTNTPQLLTTQTPTPLPTTTNTPTPTATPTPLSTATNTPIPTPTIQVIDRFESPDGEWLALLEGVNAYRMSANYTFRAIHTQSGLEWIVESFGYEEYSIIGFDSRIPIHWSKNGEYLYYIYHRPGDGCGPSSIGYKLHRFNLQNGVNVELVPRGRWFAIAPNEEKVAYILNEQLVLQDLESSEETIVEIEQDPTFEYLNFSYPIWSPDSNFILVHGIEDICRKESFFDEVHSLIVQVNAESYLQTTILQTSSSLRLIAWEEQNKVQVYIQNNYAWLNPETGEITPIDE